MAGCAVTACAVNLDSCKPHSVSSTLHMVLITPLSGQQKLDRLPTALNTTFIAGDLAFLSPGFLSIGLHKLALIKTILSYKVDIVLSDVDTGQSTPQSLTYMSKRHCTLLPVSSTVKRKLPSVSLCQSGALHCLFRNDYTSNSPCASPHMTCYACLPNASLFN